MSSRFISFLTFSVLAGAGSVLPVGKIWSSVLFPSGSKECCSPIIKSDQYPGIGPVTFHYGDIVFVVNKTGKRGDCWYYEQQENCYYYEIHGNSKCSYTVQVTVTNNATVNNGSIDIDYGAYNSTPPHGGGTGTVHSAGGHLGISQFAEHWCNGDWQTPSDWCGIIVSWKWSHGIFWSDAVDFAFNCDACDKWY